MIQHGKRLLWETSRHNFQRLLSLTGTAPQSQERTLGILVLGLTLLSFGACAGVLIWALSLL